jgi:hypothetical protein
MVGLILPFVTKPSELVGQHIVLGVDNLSVVYAWQKRARTTSIRCRRKFLTPPTSALYLENLWGMGIRRRVGNRQPKLGGKDGGGGGKNGTEKKRSRGSGSPNFLWDILVPQRALKF